MASVPHRVMFMNLKRLATRLKPSVINL